ncbi:MAG: ribonuclease P protein component [Lachnospiraceae bacterium]|nr:ribonuclease P protein component [Lachnospiraceae bacterium]
MRMFRSLKNFKEFSNVYQNGTSFANKYLVMYICENEWKENRIGISVSKKVGNSVVRHRLTRLIRESYRLNVSNILCGYDIVVVGRPNAKGRTYEEIESAFMHLVKLHHIEVTHKKVEQI